MILKYKHLIVLLMSALIISTVKAETKDQYTKIILRKIGHEFLLQIDDSTSRVLPINKNNGRYAVQIEKEFSFDPSLLSFAVFKVMEETNINESYIVEIEKCKTKELVHSFKASLKRDDSSFACKGRELPKACYIFYFTIVDNKEVIVTDKNKASTNSNYLYFITLIVVVPLIIYINRRKKNLKLNASLINIGRYQFDQKKMLLLLKGQVIELSSKEADLLFLLFSNESKTLEREYILNVVWDDEGDYVGRTLDVFISKLRKKLVADDNLKIINVRGVGYRFVIN